jgi:hypothetical protein
MVQLCPQRTLFKNKIQATSNQGYISMLASLMLGQSQREREVFRKKNVINQMKKVSSNRW